MIKTQYPEKLEEIIHCDKQIVCIIGGRGSAKSETVARDMLRRCQMEEADVMCGREYQNSIDDSVHKLLKELINNIPVPYYNITDKKIDYVINGKTRSGFRFKGLHKSPESIKSAQGFKYFWGEESQYFSQDSIDILLPTFRKEGSQIFLTANPENSNDPFSLKFITPYQDEIYNAGRFENDMLLVLLVNWRDNPFFTPELDKLRRWDYENLPRAKYDWIWEGRFNDSIEDALILAEWFDACVDAHKKLGFEALGAKISSHDPSDVGQDSKGYALRHGSVFEDIREKKTGTVNEGCDWACGLAIQHQADHFYWDADGMGISLNDQISRAFSGKNIKLQAFRGGKGVDNPDRLYCPGSMGSQIRDNVKIKEAIKNRRAQYYLELRERIYNTYLAIETGLYKDPETMISFSSSIGCLQQLKSELCRMPIKPNKNGLFEMYTKPEMKNRFNLQSPNLADTVMMSMRQPKIIADYSDIIPNPVATYQSGKRYGFR